MIIYSDFVIKLFVSCLLVKNACLKSIDSGKAQLDRSKLIVISMDGLMFSEVQENTMPFITEFYKSGVHCPTMRPVFPTKTLVNHFSIATGLYAASHGVTANEIYDNINGKLLKYSREIFMQRNVTPIWTLNELAGKNSAVSMWAAAEFEFQGLKPTYTEPFVNNADWKQRIDKIIHLLSRNENQVNFVMFYANQPDFASHDHSAQSPQVTECLKDMDNMVKYLSEQLKKQGLSNDTDIIILSDHGMDSFYFNDESFDESIIDLYRVVDKDSCDMYGSSPVLQVIARETHNQSEICLKLKAGAAQNGHYSVYTNDELEMHETWHIVNTQRVGPCTVVADPGFVFQDMTAMLKKYTDYKNLKYGTKFGAHGYDNSYSTMQAVFFANGPRFKKGVKIPFIQNIDLYHLFAKLLNIETLSEELELDGINRRDVWNQILKM